LIKILVVDDHPLLRQGLVTMLQKWPDFEIVGEAISAKDSIEKTREYRPDVVLMDIRMPGGSGIEGITAIHELMPEVKGLVLTVSDDEDDLFSAMKAGAKGYLLKNTELDSLVDAIRLVDKGEVIVSSIMASRLIAEFQQPGAGHRSKDSDELSPREKEAMQLVAQGSSNKEIARQLFISETTVKAHLRSILEKLQVKNRAEAVAKAIAKGLLTAPE